MNIYQDLEDSLYDLVIGLFPTWTIIFAYANVEEPTSPYVAIDVRKIESIGREYTTHKGEINPMTGDAVTMTIQDSLTQIRFEFVGKYDDNTTTAEMATQLEMALRTPRSFELMKLNRLALHKKLSVRRLPQKRDTDMYMIYQLDCTFAYCSTVVDDVDWIAITSVDGIYHDAGREPDHIIYTHTDIITPIP